MQKTIYYIIYFYKKYALNYINLVCGKKLHQSKPGAGYGNDSFDRNFTLKCPRNFETDINAGILLI